MADEYCSFCDPDNEPLWIETTDPEIMMLQPFKGGCTAGHVMFVPRRHALRSIALAPRAMRAALIWAESTGRGFTDYNLIMNNGECATQTVMHDHLHVVPREEDDGLQLPWSGDSKYVDMYRAMRGQNDQLRAALVSYGETFGVSPFNQDIPLRDGGLARAYKHLPDLLDEIVEAARRAG